MLVSQDNPQQTVQIFIDLIQRHEQSFYYFVHKVHSKGEGLFTGLMRWIELFLDIVREGLGDPISLEFILPHTGDERRDTIKEIDEVASSEGSSRPAARLRTSPSTPSLPKTIPRRAQEPFPPSQPSQLAAVHPPAKSPSPSVASPSSTGTRLRKLSLTLRKSRSMTFNATRPSPSNNTEASPAPVPPVPSLPKTVAQSQSAAPLTASRSKQLPALPPPQLSSASTSASPSRRPVRTPTAPTQAPPHPLNPRAPQKRYPSQNVPQAPKRQSKPAFGALKPPELKKIAELLPIFVEMVR